MIITTNGPQNIGQVKTQFLTGNLFLSAEEYQRENAWNLDQKRLLVDTIFRGMDIPKLYFWKVDQLALSEGYPEGETKNFYKKILNRKFVEDDDPNPYIFEVVDGQQRIRTILEYMDVRPPNDYVYRGVWGNSFLSMNDTPMAKGKNFSQLTANQQIRFKECPLSIMVLERANIEEIRDMFLRLQNGTPLSAQQKRDAMGSNIGTLARKLSTLPFFIQSVYFDNNAASHHLVASQMINLEIRERVISCTSRQLDKLYENYKKVPIENAIISKVNKVLGILGKIFPEKNPHLNRSYALSLYWVISRIIETYNISEIDYPKIRENFEAMDDSRLSAMNRDYSIKPNDEIYFDLSFSMSRGTDGADGISVRHDTISQFLFDGVSLNLIPTLDPQRAFSHEEKLILFRRAGARCQLEHNGKLCGRQLDFDNAVCDHIIPHSKEGKTTLENGRISYKSCNIARGNRDDFDPETMCNLIAT